MLDVLIIYITYVEIEGENIAQFLYDDKKCFLMLLLIGV